MAEELWRLSGHRDRAERISAVLDRVHGRDERVMVTADIDDLIADLEGLEEAATSALCGPDGLLDDEAIASLRMTSEYLYLDEGGPQVPEYAVMEALPKVWALRELLREARTRGLWIALS
ncbi:MAG: hypothetical protein R3B06_00815 [Kofleriaceae bacterium]